MPYSANVFNNVVTKYIEKKWDKGKKIIDIGAGAGKWGSLLSSSFNLDAVEIYEPYINQFGLENVYGKVHNCDIKEFSDYSEYDYAIVGDVLEHLSIEDAKVLIKKLNDSLDDFVVIVPFKMEQESVYGNDNEIHLQPDLTEEIMQERYPELSCNWVVCVDGIDMGWYVKRV